MSGTRSQIQVFEDQISMPRDTQSGVRQSRRSDFVPLPGNMLTRLLVGCSLMAICVMIHAGGLMLALRRLRERVLPRGFWPSTWLFVVVAIWIVLLHCVEILLWAVVYLWNGAMPDLASSIYFSAVTYTTTGYGDLVLPNEWRLDAGMEALTGILMCGWSTGFFFAIVSRLCGAPAAAGRP